MGYTPNCPLAHYSNDLGSLEILLKGLLIPCSLGKVGYKQLTGHSRTSNMIPPKKMYYWIQRDPGKVEHLAIFMACFTIKKSGFNNETFA